MEVHTALVLSVQLIALFSIAGALLLYLLCKVRGSRGTNSNPQVGSILITSADTALGLQLCTFLANKGLKVFAGMKDIDDSLPAKLLKGWMKARECMDLDDERSFGQILPLKIDVNKEDILREATESIGSYLNAGERGILAVINTSGSVYRKRNKLFCSLANSITTFVFVLRWKNRLSGSKHVGKYAKAQRAWLFENIQSFPRIIKTHKVVIKYFYSQRNLSNALFHSTRGRFIFLGNGSVGDGLVAYQASRNAVEGCASALREELKPYGINVVTLDSSSVPAESLFKAPVPFSNKE